MRRLLGPALAGLLVLLLGVGQVLAEEKLSSPQQVANNIDKMIDARLTAEKITPSERCDDAEFLRRVHLDLTGKIPTAAKTTAFLDSKDADKRAKLVDELLASKDYGLYFATTWRNLMVRPDANMIRPPDTTPFVRWMADQFNSDKGWDKIVADMLTVEGNAPQNMFFILNGDSRAAPQANVATGSIGQLFMGVQMACAECHNHPFVDSWEQTDFWGVAAFFGRVKLGGNAKAAVKGGQFSITEGPGKLDKKRNFAPETGKGASIVIPNTAFKQIGKVVQARFPHGETPKMADDKPFRPAFANWLTAKDNPFFAANAVNRMWAHTFGKGFANPVGEMSEINPPSHPDLLKFLARDFAQSGFDQKWLIRSIMLSNAYQRTSRPNPGNKVDDHLFARQEIKVMPPEVLYDSLCIALGVDDLNKAVVKSGKKAGKTPGMTPKQAFINFFTTKEADADPTDYTHGIPQALRLMNQDAFNTGGRSVDAAISAGGGSEKIIERLYVSALSRRPTKTEHAEMTAYAAKHNNSTAAYRGVFWSLINSAEFILNR